jgi:hypothetical protein
MPIHGGSSAYDSSTIPGGESPYSMSIPEMQQDGTSEGAMKAWEHRQREERPTLMGGRPISRELAAQREIEEANSKSHQANVAQKCARRV